MKKLLSTIIIAFSLNVICAQIDSTSLESETVSVVKSYEAQIQKAQQRKIDVKVPKKRKVKTSYTYRLNNKTDIDFDREEPVISPYTFSDDKAAITDRKDGLIYGAYGNNRTIKLGGAYQYYIEDWLETGVQLDHHSNRTVRNITQYSPSTNITKGRLYGSYFLNQRTKVGLEGHGAFEQREAFLIPNINSNELILNLPTNTFGGTVNLSHTSFENLGIVIRSKFGFDRIQQTIDREDPLTTNENLISAENNILKRINNNISIESDVNYRRITLSTSQAKLTSSDLILRPQVRYKSNLLSTKIGIEYIKGDDDNFIFPIIDVNLGKIYKDIDIRFYTDSEYDRSDMKYLNSNNPFITYNLNSIRPVYAQNYNLNISRKISFLEPSLEFTYSRFINEVQFINLTDANTLMSSLFEIDFIDRSELSLTPRIVIGNEILNLDLNMTYHHFLDMKNVEVLYRPQYELELTASEKVLNEKLSLSQSIHYSAKRFGRNSDGLNSELDPILDISFTLDYHLSDTFTVFGEAYNLLDSSYEIWNGIDNYGRQFWGGLRFKF